MDTNRIKKFATEARNKLKAGIAAKIITLGFDKNGNVPEHMHPQLMQGGSLWNGQLQTEGFYYQWMALYKRVQQKGIKEVYEEAAYTWFNRLVAIRILMKNQLIEPVLEYVDAARTPRIVDEARMGRIPQMQERQRQLLMELLDDDSKTTEQFAILVTAFCHDNPILFKCFGAMSDYTELLLPNDILTEGGFIDLLNHTEFITDADFHSPELIGWLYQFYISERKDEVFASFKKGKKAEAEEIPAATQIFTPNWIVKYMVQNTIGRIYLDNNPGAVSEFKPKWQYLVEPSEPTPKEAIYKYKELTDLLVGDLACGSGHILNECFDLLYDLYIYEGYSRREAVEYIFTHNLRGIDLDTRAKQLATFALMLKACQKDSSFADAHVLPKVLDMPKVDRYTWRDLNGHMTCALQIQGANEDVYQELDDCFDLMKDAENLGSIMKFSINDATRSFIRECLDKQSQRDYKESFNELFKGLELIQMLTDTYTSLIANPPYMGRNNMNQSLLSYLDKNYNSTKQDLFSTFMQLMLDKTVEKGKSAFVTMESWMFLSSFMTFRHFILEETTIDSLIHMPYLGKGWTPMGISFGTAACVISNECSNIISNFQYIRYYETSKESSEPLSFPTINERYSNISQKYFKKIPGWAIGYWVTHNFIKTFTNYKSLADISKPTQGLATADNTRFIRFWHEVNAQKIGFNYESSVDALSSGKKWFPCDKGGDRRRWYGNQSEVINWEHDGYEIRNFFDSKGKLLSRPQNLEYNFIPSISWNMITTGGISFRLFPKGFIHTNASNSYTCKDILGVLGYLNSNYAQEVAEIINPTINLSNGVVGKFPYIVVDKDEYRAIVQQCVDIAKTDWDSHETSWDFEANPLVALRNESVASGNLESSFKFSAFVEQFETIWEERFNQLHKNEEELNRQFIDIYGLQDELSPEVPKNEITILQQGEIKLVQTPGSDNDYTLQWNEDVLMKQLISYAVGVWMGRYKLGTKGLHIAHPNPTDKELQEYWYGGVQMYIDDDGLIPILPQSSPFDDNLSSRISDFVRITFGEDKLTENLNYIEQKLGTSIDQYVQKDFWKDHKKMYQNRPIYWLFSSSKGAFKCLAYMHRMNAYTAERVRSNYLLPYIEFLQNQIGEMENRRATLSTAENRKLQNFQKALEECREYHERLQVVAEQAIAFDLDDGVVVNYAKFGDVLAKIK